MASQGLLRRPDLALTIELIPHCTSDLAELYEAGDFGEPAAGQVPELMARARGGWYTLQFTPDGLTVTPHDPVAA
jgi:hypothetical protein